MPQVRRRTRSLLAAVVALLGVLALVAPTPAGAQEPAPAARPDPRIIGGTQTAPGTWRSQAAILNAGVRDNADAQICGGTVIDPTWVITAAHCVTGFDDRAVPAAQRHVLVGTHDLESGGTRIPVRRIVVRADYDGFGLTNDVALLQLARPASVPRDLVVASRTDIPWSGAPLRTAGWGMTDLEGQEFPTRLREVGVPAMDPGECKLALDEAEGFAGTPPYHSSHLCTGPIGRGGQGPCYGDSGGPLVWETGGRKVLVGIVSWGAYCGSPETPSVFAKVASASAWIARTTQYGPHPTGVDFAFATHDDYWAWADRNPVAVPSNPGEPGAYIAGFHDDPGVVGRDAMIVRLYDAVFDRTADAWGYQYWREQVAFRGIGASRVAEVMARSSEFRATYGHLADADFVAQLYLNVLGRSGSPDDVAFWTARLGAGATRGRVVAQIAESGENRARTQASVDVQVAFLNLVRRAPAAWEMAEWTPKPLAELGRFLVHSVAYADRWGYWWGTPIPEPTVPAGS